MGIRKGIFIGATMLSIMACTACGNSGGNISETNGAETSTGVESGIIEQPQVMYDGHIYYYNACGDYSRATSYRFVKILEFTHFCSFFNFGRTDVKRHKKQIVDRIHVVVGYRVDTRDTIFFDE